MTCRGKSVGIIISLFMFFGAAAFFGNKGIAQEETYKIGEKGPAGGWIFYDKGNYTDGWRYLEAAPEEQTTKEGAEWGFYKQEVADAKGTAIGTGKSNTQAILKRCGEKKIAAKLCAEYRGGGKNDWFLPSKDELHLMYKNLRLKGIGDFNKIMLMYWSSSEFNADWAWFEDFSGGRDDQRYFRKKNMYCVRAIRAF